MEVVSGGGAVLAAA
ncbi:hypothetical protein A2U01_0093375, partial [Trifolium medium]|nr:hypothetical protein [Trifolium medium]